MELTSSAFGHRGAIPSRHTCDGDNLSPPLAWRGAPDGTRSFVLIVDDPDAPDPARPKRVWVHWLVYNLPPTSCALPEGGHLPEGARTGRNDSHGTDWDSVCPPIGRHRYFFKLYALDTELPDLKTPAKAALETAMHGHVIAQAELMGTYRRSGR
ncbi:MAG: YbhB/YbcL family Raf kinase inhibitor-like protein [Acidobacteria bacterium]|nr:YbhB/YbcL family Raf kinase inhibitor-like protein [Acidobacteriota bacterium]